MDQAKKPTMKDLAREAGVSLGTVSKVINGLPVGEEYRLRVEEAIAKLDYRINTFAKGLRSGKTMMVALILPNLTSPFFSWLANSIGNELASRKYRMLLFCTNDAPEQEQECVRLAEQQKVDGVICLSFRSDLAMPEGVRFISVDRSLRPEIPCVSSDNYAGGWLAAQKLAEFGCTRPAMLCIGSAVPNEPAKRRDGFAAGCAALGLPCEIKSLSDGDPCQGFEDFLTEHYHDGSLDFDGLFCITDSLAHQTLASLRRLGLRVPEDVQIIGFDGCRHFGDLDLTCSTIVQPVREISAACVELLLQEEKTLTPSLVCLPVSFAPGGTTKE